MKCVPLHAESVRACSRWLCRRLIAALQKTTSERMTLTCANNCHLSQKRKKNYSMPSMLKVKCRASPRQLLIGSIVFHTVSSPQAIGVRPDNTQRENLFPFRPVNESLVRQKIDVLLRVIFLECDSDNPKITIFYGRQVMGIR